jgi:hypothetical protein
MASSVRAQCTDISSANCSLKYFVFRVKTGIFETAQWRVTSVQINFFINYHYFVYFVKWIFIWWWMATLEPKYTIPCPLKARIIEPEETAVTRQWFGKHDSAVTDTHVAREELLYAVFSVGSSSRLSLYVDVGQETEWASLTRVEAGSNTSTVTLRVVTGDEMGLKKAAP